VVKDHQKGCQPADQFASGSMPHTASLGEKPPKRPMLQSPYSMTVNPGSLTFQQSVKKGALPQEIRSHPTKKAK